MHLFLLNNLVTLLAQLKSKQKELFLRISSKNSWPNIAAILSYWTKRRLPVILNYRAESTEPNFVKLRYKLGRRAHHLDGDSSYFGNAANVLEDQSYQIWFSAKFFGDFANNLSK